MLRRCWWATRRHSDCKNLLQLLSPKGSALDGTYPTWNKVIGKKEGRVKEKLEEMVTDETYVSICATAKVQVSDGDRNIADSVDSDYLSLM